MNVLTIGKHLLGRYRPKWQEFLAGGKCDFHSFCLSPAPVLYRLSVRLSSEASSSMSTSRFSPSELKSDVQSCNQGKTHVDLAVAASRPPGAPGRGVETGATPGKPETRGHCQEWPQSELGTWAWMDTGGRRGRDHTQGRRRATGGPEHRLGAQPADAHVGGGRGRGSRGPPRTRTGLVTRGIVTAGEASPQGLCEEKGA